MNQGIWLNRILKAWIERHVPNPLSILYCARAYSDTLKNGGGFFVKFGVYLQFNVNFLYYKTNLVQTYGSLLNLVLFYSGISPTY